jgi:PAS domain S-box-containing protein
MRQVFSKTRLSSTGRTVQASSLMQTVTLIAGGNPLPVILDAIVRCVEAEHPGVLGSVLLLDDAGRQLFHGAGPQLPDFYIKAIDGVEIGPLVGSCGTAAFQNATVIVDDIATDPRWANFKDLAAEAGLGACWSQPIRGTNGKVLGTFAMYHARPTKASPEDISSINDAAHLAAIAIERRRSEEALEASEARTRLLGENATDIIILTNRESIVTYMAPSVARVTGYDPDRLVGRGLLSMVHPQDAPAMAESRKALFRSRKQTGPISNEYRARHRDGHWLWLEARSTVIRDPVTGEATGTLDVSRDITARKQLEQALQDRTREAQSAVTAKADFLANMSHEIRTPLTAILGFSDVLRHMSDMPPQAAPYLRRIAVAGEALLTVVNDVLDLSRIEAGELELRPQVFDPRTFLLETTDLVQTQARAKGLELQVELADLLPAFITADSGRLRQVLLNLLANAIKFTDKGSVRLSASYETARGGALSVRITDTGPGISEDQQDRLFKRFSQLQSSVTRQHGGSGLGLAICHRLTEMMGGAIGVDSAPGQGASFWFNISAPCRSHDLTRDDAITEQAPARPARILAVDDLEANRALVKALLTPFGHEITEACGGEDAVQIASATPFDLILMDLQMPVMDGMEATQSIRRGGGPNRQTPIVALTANVLPQHVADCLHAGMNDHITKPIDLGELLGKVAHWTTPLTA